MDTMYAAVPTLSSDLPDNSTLVRVVALSGFGLRERTDGAVITEGVVRGSVLGGLIDDELLTAPSGRHLLTSPVSDKAADDAGLVCGGVAHILLSPISDLPSEFFEALITATPLVVACRTDGSGTDVVITARDFFGVASEHLINAARLQLSVGHSAIITADGVDYLASVIAPTPRVFIAGSGPIAEAIKAQGQLIGWEMTVSEDGEAGAAFISSAGPADAIIVLSHDPNIDTPLLSQAIRSSVGYVGAMGSRGTQTARRGRLARFEHSEQEISRIHGPVGLDLGARTPSETAVSIVAEYLSVRSGRQPIPLHESSGAINR